MNIKRIFLSALLIAIISGGTFLIISSVPAGQSKEVTELKVRYMAPTHPEKPVFAGEQVPTDLFWVKEGFDRELLINAYWHSSTFQLIKRANRYFPVIEEILSEEGVPEDFKYLAVAESNLLPVVSPAGARGIWQFMPSTAKEYDLQVDRNVDQRYHLEIATRAACTYIKEARDTFGSWTLAAAAYNAGFNGIRRVLDEQKADNYYDLHLNPETARYIFRILALKTVMEDPESYGFFLLPKDLYAPLRYKTIEIRETIDDLPSFAKEQGISYRALKELNPWLRSERLPVNGESYTIMIPDEKGSWYPN